MKTRETETAAPDMLIYMTKQQFMQAIEDALERQQEAIRQLMISPEAAYDEKTLRGGKEIAGVLGISRATLHQYKEELLACKAIYYEGRCLRGSRRRVLQWRDERMMR